MTGSRWCPSCGDEYEPRIRTCLDCGVPLVDYRPEVLDPVVTVEAADVVEPALRFDIGEFTEEERRDLLAELDEASIPVFLVDDDTLEAVPGYEVELRDVIIGPAPTWRPWLRRPVALEGQTLTLRRRIVSVVVDAAVALGLTVAAVRLIDDGGVAVVVILTLLFFNQAYGLGERGSSIGKRLAGARLVSVHHRPITIGEATTRWLLRDTFLMVGIAIAAAINGPSGIWIVLELVAVAYLLGLASSVLLDSQGRGLHDHLVDSVVIRAPTDIA